MNGSGSIVNTASVGGIRGVGNQSGYSASKHGVVGLTRNSGIEYGQFGININAIAPGAIMTPMVEASLKQIGGEDGWEDCSESTGRWLSYSRRSLQEVSRRKVRNLH